jgi:prepilin-type N-terminal cleavage/methylation domain-containing protein
MKTNRGHRAGLEVNNPHSTWSLPSNDLIGGIPHSKGFTLIEIIIVIVILGILSTVAAMIILEGAKSYSIEDSRSNAHYQARLAMERMAREIRLIRSQTAADITTMGANTIRYSDIFGAQMGFRLTGTTIERTQDNAATWQPLATGVTALTFTYFQQDGSTVATATTLWYVVIDITEQPGTEMLSMSTRVHPRNFY